MKIPQWQPGDPNWKIFAFIAETFGLDVFIETGSGHGRTAFKALDIFKEVYTIEWSESLYEETKKRLQNTRARCYHGKSPEQLRIILPDILSPVFYWLDAHWSQGPTAGENDQCPLLRELEVINNRDMNYDFIVIDDIHTFFSPAALKPPMDYKQFPGIPDILRLLNRKERYTVILTSWRCMNHGQPGGIVMPEDMMISVPLYAKDQLNRFLEKFNLEN